MRTGGAASKQIVSIVAVGLVLSLGAAGSAGAGRRGEPVARHALGTETCPGSQGPKCASSQFGYPYPNAPDCSETGTAGCVLDQWRFYQGQCTSWVAYRLNQLNGVAFDDFYGGKGAWGDASNWGARAGSLNIPVNGSPAPGAVAWWDGGDHVAYVEAVNSPTSIVISEMNYDFHNGFRIRTITTSSGWPDGFIHIKDTSGGGTSDGSFVQVSGQPEIYRMAGGAPVYVSSWSDVGGKQSFSVISQKQFDGLRQYPADGTFVADGGKGKGPGACGCVYRFAGGAPTYVSDWNDVGGVKPVTVIDSAAIANADQGGRWNHVRQYPADGTLLTVLSGAVYRVVSGIATPISSAGVGTPTLVDKADIDKAGQPAPWNHLRAPLPTVKKVPVVRGAAAVRHRLHTSTGTWTSSPTRYRYQWLRCSSRGSSCARVLGATAQAYALKTADRGHKIRVKVWAHNATGWSRKSAKSTATTVVH